MHGSPQDEERTDLDRLPAAPPLRAVFEHMSGFVAVLSADGVVLEANGAAVRLAGMDRDRIIGRSIAELPCWGEAAGELLRAAIARAANGSFQRLGLDTVRDAPAHLDCSLTPLVRDGAVIAIIAEARDTAMAADVEHELRLSEARFAGIVNIASDAIISTDENFTIVHFNRGAEAIFGYSAAEALGRPLDILIPERFRTAHRRHMHRFGDSPVAARRMGERQEIAGLRRSGEEFPAEASISKIQVGGAMLYTVVLRDVSDRRRAEYAQRFLSLAGQQLAASLDLETTLRVVAELAVDFLADCCVIYDADAHGALRRVEVFHRDDRFESLAQELRGTTIDPSQPHPAFAVLETGVPELIEDVAAHVKAHGASPSSLRLLRTIGAHAAMLVPLVARDRTIGVLALYATAADRRYGAEELAVARELASRAAFAVDNARLYREAEKAIEARDDVLAVVSHELGNPLSAIRIGTSLLLRGLPEEERGRGGWTHLDGIRQSAEQMERLVNDLLEVKRIEAGQLALDLERHGAAALVRDSVELFQPLAAERGLTLEIGAAPERLVLRCDRDRLLQVFSNLIGNALKFTPAGGRIEVSVTPAGDEVVFAVSDTGRGIAPEELPHVFDRFWRAQRMKREGIGLGLAIARGIVQMHGGRMWAESTPGVGSTFHFALPLDAAESAPAPA